MAFKPPIPRRAFVLDLKVEADTLEDLIGYLRTLEIDLYMDKISTGVSGGSSSGAIYSLSVDESITHNAWAAANEAYVRHLKGTERA